MNIYMIEQKQNVLALFINFLIIIKIMMLNYNIIYNIFKVLFIIFCKYEFKILYIISEVYNYYNYYKYKYLFNKIDYL